MIVLSWTAGALVVLVVLVAVFWALDAEIDSKERASRPKALLDAELLYAEKMFRVSRPVSLVAKVDRAYRTPTGLVVLVEFKSRWINGTFLSDVVQLSAQKLALKGRTRLRVARYGYVVVKTPSKGAFYAAHRVELMPERGVVAMVRRWENLITNRVAPRFAVSRKVCRTCAFRSECDSPRLPDV